MSCPSRPRGRPRDQRVLLPDLRGQRGPGVHVPPRPGHEGGGGGADQELWADAIAAPHGATPAQELGHAPGELGFFTIFEKFVRVG